jgi:outer membrane protein OmpA-like peptidoglycan-associated protein
LAPAKSSDLIVRFSDLVMGMALFRRRGGAQVPLLALRLAIPALLIGLSACSPVAAYRHLVGTAQDDPNPATTPNTKNLAAGGAKNYPNLATVPEPPSQALSTAQMNKLTQSLIADRTNAKYTTQQLQAGFDESGAPVPPPPPPLPAAPPAPKIAPPSAAVSSTGPAAPPAQPAGSGAVAGNGSGKAATASGAAPTGLRKSGQPPEPGPMESSLKSPQIAPLPTPQQVEPAPPPPSELETASGNAGTGAATGPAHLPPPPAPAPLPAAMASAKFEPPPPPPVLPPATPTRTASAGGPGKVAAAQPVDTPVAEVDFVGSSTTLDIAGRQELERIVPLYRREPAKVRVIGYAGVGNSAVAQLNGFQTALDRAHAVAAVLSQAGIPANKILVEAAPADQDTGQGRAEILFER